MNFADMDIVNRQKGLEIDPFWNRIPAFFLYGLKPVPLLLSTLSGILIYLTSSIWILLILYAVAVKYSMAGLQHTLQGELSPPPLNSEVIVKGYELPLALFFILLIYTFALSSIASSFSPLLAILLLLLGFLLFPALVMCLGISESFTFALNPLNWLALATTIGWPYLALYGLYLSFGGAQATVEYLVLDEVSRASQAPVWMALNTLFMIISFHMMGYVALQYHRELDIRPSALQDDTDRPDSPLLDQFIQAGNSAAAIEELLCLIRDHPNDIELRKKLHNYAMLNQEYATVAKQAPAYMQMLTKAKNYNAAAQLFSDCRKADIPCFPASPEQYLPIFDILRQRGQTKEAIALSKNFHSRFPDSDFTPPIYFALAKLFSEQMQRDDMAKQLLRFLIKHFSTHATIGQVRQYLQLLESF
jgi:tetratricopeptide (TPR) repeat protein